jgi:phage terminase small subunit
MGESKELEGLEDLTVKQRAYVLAYLETGSQRQAALDAGYSPASADQQGSVLMRNRKIRAAILRLEAKAVDRVTEIVDVTAEKVISGLWKEAQREGKGASHSARIQAYATLAKIMGMMKDKVEVTHINHEDALDQLASPIIDVTPDAAE